MMAQQVHQEKDRLDLAPKKFVMWLFVFASFMIFAALTSGFIVYAGGHGHALNLRLPDIFIYSTSVIVLSSLTMFMASRSAKRLEFDRQRLFLWLTVALGILFFVLQVYGWYILTYKMGIYFVNPNASQSFIYVFTGVHLLHIVAGIMVLLSALYISYRNRPQAINLYRMEIASIFWHFLDIMWIYLYVFLLLNQN
ncbi:MAG: heme-copper oxidase subunit III [Bacteroidetes bacterium]|nr:heme-copper oxidase subunit III [Bacteroidota bacterium]